MASFHALRYFRTVSLDLRPDTSNPQNSLIPTERLDVVFLPSWVNAHTIAARFHSDAVTNSPKPLVLAGSGEVVQVTVELRFCEPRRQLRGDDEHRL